MVTFDKVFHLNLRKCIMVLLSGMFCKVQPKLINDACSIYILTDFFCIASVYFFLDNRAKSERCM